MQPPLRGSVAALAVALLVAAGCMETRRALGDDCLKDEDCLSGICSQLHCAAAAPTTDAQAVSEAAAAPVADAAPGEGAAD